MYQINHANLNGILSLEKLHDFEKEYNLKLPTDYLNFLVRYNGGIPYPSIFGLKPMMEVRYNSSMVFTTVLPTSQLTHICIVNNIFQKR